MKRRTMSSGVRLLTGFVLTLLLMFAGQVEAQTVIRRPPEVAECGSTIENEFTEAFEVHSYTLDLQVTDGFADQLTLSLTPLDDGVELYLFVFGPEDSVFEATAGDLPSWTVTVMETGEHVIVVQNHINLNQPGALGMYTLSVLCDVVAQPVTLPPVDAELVRDETLLALFVPGDVPVDLSTFAYRADDEMHPISGYPAFDDLTLEAVPTPICLVLRQGGGDSPLPLVCQRLDGGQVFIQALNSSDNFWYDTVNNVQRTFEMVDGDESLGFCGSGNVECDVQVQAAGEVVVSEGDVVTDTPVPSPTDVPSPVPTTAPASAACTATITFGSGGLLNQVRLQPSPNAPFRPPVPRGSEVEIVMAQTDFGTTWYQIVYQASNGDTETGWIPSEFVENLSSGC